MICDSEGTRHGRVSVKVLNDGLFPQNYSPPTRHGRVGDRHFADTYSLNAYFKHQALDNAMLSFLLYASSDCT